MKANKKGGRKLEHQEYVRRILSACAGLVIGLITVIAAIYILILVFFFGGPPKVTKGIEKYEQTMKENTTREYGKARTEFLIFPKKVPESAFEQEGKPDIRKWWI